MNTFLRSVVLSTLLLCGLSSTACSSSKTVRTETSTSNDGVVHTEKETTVESSDNHSNSCAGVLSCTVDILGEIIAFPFKAVGALVGAIF